MKPNRHPHDKSGFTLVELLVVVAIVATLALVTFSLVGRSIEKARSATDLIQMRELAILIGCVSASDGRLPLSQLQGGTWMTWMDRIRADSGGPSLGSDKYKVSDVEPFLSRKQNVSIPSETPTATMRTLKHFAAIEASMPWRTNNDTRPMNGVRVTSIRRPGELALLVDSQSQKADDPLKNSHMVVWSARSRWWQNNSWAATDKPENAEKVLADPGVIDFRNNGKAHVLFVDGHVRAMEPEDLKQKYFTNAY